MAKRLRLPSTIGMLADPVEIPSDNDGKLTENAVATLNSFMRSATRLLNGGVSFGDGRQSTHAGHIDGHTIEFVAPPVADTEFEIPHDLGRVPIGFLALAQDGPGVLYKSNPGGWGVERVFLKCSEANVTWLIVLV
jgi:hypothetical protein